MSGYYAKNARLINLHQRDASLRTALSLIIEHSRIFYFKAQLKNVNEIQFSVSLHYNSSVIVNVQGLIHIKINFSKFSASPNI